MLLEKHSKNLGNSCAPCILCSHYKKVVQECPKGGAAQTQGARYQQVLIFLRHCAFLAAFLHHYSISVHTVRQRSAAQASVNQALSGTKF